MKIIDEKGRLFGKLNLIDLLVIILLIAAVAAVAWKLVGKKAAEAVADTGRTITYTVTVEDVNREAAEFASTQIGKSLVNNSKVVDAANVVVVGVGDDESIEVMVRRPQHLRTEIRSAINQYGFTFGAHNSRSTKSLIVLVARAAYPAFAAYLRHTG